MYSDSSSFEYIRSSLEKTLLSNLEQDVCLPFQVVVTVMVMVRIMSKIRLLLVMTNEIVKIYCDADDDEMVYI